MSIWWTAANPATWARASRSTLTKAAMGGEEVFTSHPNKELLKIHDPEKFGCTPCHGGNGAALSSVEKAHGYNKYLALADAPQGEHRGRMPAVPRRSEIVTEMADTLNAGREIFRLRGCMGCHRYEGFDREADEMSSVNQQIRARSNSRRPSGCARPASAIQKGDKTRDNAEAQKLYAHANDLKVRASGLDAKMEQLDMRARSLVREQKKVGPSLKEVRVKLRKEWIPVWLQGSARVARRHQDADLPAGRRRDPRDRRVHLAIGRAGRRCRRRSRAIRRRARKRSKPAAAWPATRWAKAARSRAGRSPPT